jgi:hypothetical protein
MFEICNILFPFPILDNYTKIDKRYIFVSNTIQCFLYNYSTQYKFKCFSWSFYCLNFVICFIENKLFPHIFDLVFHKRHSITIINCCLRSREKYCNYVHDETVKSNKSCSKTWLHLAYLWMFSLLKRG